MVREEGGGRDSFSVGTPPTRCNVRQAGRVAHVGRRVVCGAGCVTACVLCVSSHVQMVPFPPFPSLPHSHVPPSPSLSTGVRKEQLLANLGKMGLATPTRIQVRELLE